MKIHREHTFKKIYLRMKKNTLWPPFYCSLECTRDYVSFYHHTHAKYFSMLSWDIRGLSWKVYKKQLQAKTHSSTYFAPLAHKDTDSFLEHFRNRNLKKKNCWMPKKMKSCFQNLMESVVAFKKRSKEFPLWISGNEAN